jgi:hypothetical protein
VLGLENKVQAILLIGALPLLVLPFGSAASPSVVFWNSGRSRWLATAIAAVAAIAATWAASPLFAIGFDRALLDAAHFHPLLLGRFGIYQAALLILIGACMIAYAAIWRVSAAETLASMFAVAAGASIALLALDLEYNTGNAIAVFNPLEKMLTFADADTTDVTNGSNLLGVALLLLDGGRIGSGALHLRAALLTASDRVSHLADRPGHHPGVAAQRKTRHDPGARASAGRDRDRRAWRAARIEIGIFHLHRPPDHPRRRNLARFPERLALSQMGLSRCRCSVRAAYRRRPGRADQIRLQAKRPGLDMRMEPIPPSAIAAALVRLSAGSDITAC